MSLPAIRTRGLRKRYPGITAVDGLDLEVRTGEVFGLLGPNGAGKTTTLEMIEGLTEPDEGTIEVLGLPLRGQGRKVRERIGVQLQSTSLFQRITAREALQHFGALYPRRQDPMELLDLVGLREKADVQQTTLSGGQKQRLALALALVNDPELVFLDEPTTGLDPQARRAIWEVVRRLKAEGRTVVLTTHYMDEAEVLCDRLVILDQGKVLTEGSPRSLIQELDVPSLVELTFEGELPDAGAFRGRLGQEVNVREGLWEIPTRDPKSLLPRVLEAAEGLVYDQIHVRRATLEDLFLHRTGRSLRD